jgi:hypothetical protein
MRPALAGLWIKSLYREHHMQQLLKDSKINSNNVKVWIRA